MEKDESGSKSNDTGLTDLGVSVYDQDEFEAGVMKHLDEAAEKQANEQQRKFAEKELVSVERNIRRTKEEITKYSKAITTLLSRPLPDVVHQLKEVKQSQANKKQSLAILEERLKLIQQCLHNDDFSSLYLHDDATEDNREKERLIRTGLITPFASSSSSSQSNQQPRQSKAKETLRSDSNVSLAEFNWLGLGEREPKNKGKGRSKAKQKDSLMEEHMSANEERLRQIMSETESNTAQTNASTSGLDTGTGSYSGWLEKVESDSVERGSRSEGSKDNDVLNSSDESYVTDEELGGRSGKRKGYKRLRDFSGEESDGDMVHTNWSKGKERKKKKRTIDIGVDDGDEGLYRARMKAYKSSLVAEEEPPFEFEGGFRVPNSIWSKLYRYQQTGVRWLWELHCQEAGGIMGDEMGLGKTIQMIAFLAGLKISNLRSHVTRELGLGPVLIVAPATVLQQWVSEFHKWWPLFRVAILHDTGSYVGTKGSFLSRIAGVGGVVITTYACIRMYRDLLQRQQWDYIILDEGHKIRNPDADITLSCKQFATPHRIILSGSPVQNNLRELWSLFDFVFPGKLGTLPVFMEQFSIPITVGGYANASQLQVETAYRCACMLRDTINPYLLRRLKSDVKLHLPDKSEQVLFCRLTDYQRELYEDYINGPEVERMLSGRSWVFPGLVKLRKLCNHPDLVTNDYSKNRASVVDELEEEEEGGGDFEGVSSVIDTATVKRKRLEEGRALPESEEVYGYYRRSGKMIVVEALLKLWKEQNHKVLFFSQSRQMLDIMERFLGVLSYSYLKMDGGTSIAHRQSLIKQFNEDASIFVFLLTTRVGGLGVNLTGANRIIIYDPDWNPSTDVQARERAWRIGQTRSVTIYRLLTSGTIEEKIYHRQIFKQFLTNRVLRDPRQRRFFKSNSLYELFTLGSDEGPHKTETGAIFAGTGSEINLSSKKSRRGKKRKSKTAIDTSERQEPEPVSQELEPVSQEPEPVPSCSKDVKDTTAIVEQMETEGEVVDMELSAKRSKQTDNGESIPNDDIQSLMLASSSKRKKKKKKKRRKLRDAEIDGCRIAGLDKTDTYNPGSEDEENSNTARQDDHILKKLFKKTGVHSAMRHDVIINSSDPDYTLVESEANRAAQSAARALKTSRQQCLGTSSRWGQPTWTGQNGTIGGPQVKFGEGSNLIQSVSTNHFTGEAGSEGTLNTSSSVLLSRMKKRNAHSLNSSSIHTTEQHELLNELRGFIAHQCKHDGRATTSEILGKFTSKVVPSDSALFRAMLHQVCDFHRSHGDGIWTLKAEYR